MRKVEKKEDNKKTLENILDGLPDEIKEKLKDFVGDEKTVRLMEKRDKAENNPHIVKVVSRGTANLDGDYNHDYMAILALIISMDEMGMIKIDYDFKPKGN